MVALAFASRPRARIAPARVVPLMAVEGTLAMIVGGTAGDLVALVGALLPRASTVTFAFTRPVTA